MQQPQTIPTECSLKLSTGFALLDEDLQSFTVQRILGFELSNAEVACAHGCSLRQAELCNEQGHCIASHLGTIALSPDGGSSTMQSER